MLRMNDTCVRTAVAADAPAIAAIYNQGIEDRTATFETRPRTPEDILSWLDGRQPVVVAESGGRVLAFAACATYRARACYAGVAEFSVYVARDARRSGLGRQVMEELIRQAEAAGRWKLVSRVFVENTPSRALLRTLGFRELGVYERHGMLEGRWRDVVIVERLLGEAGAT